MKNASVAPSVCKGPSSANLTPEVVCAAATAEASMPEFIQPVPAGAPSLIGPDLQPLKPLVPGVYCRRAHTKEQAQAQLAAVTGGAR